MLPNVGRQSRSSEIQPLKISLKCNSQTMFIVKNPICTSNPVLKFCLRFDSWIPDARRQKLFQCSKICFKLKVWWNNQQLYNFHQTVIFIQMTSHNHIKPLKTRRTTTLPCPRARWSDDCTANAVLLQICNVWCKQIWRQNFVYSY